MTIRFKVSGPDGRENEEGVGAYERNGPLGFDGSTYVRTVKMVLAEKRFTQFKQMPLNVLKGDPRTPEHLQRHPCAARSRFSTHDEIRILRDNRDRALSQRRPFPGSRSVAATATERRRRTVGMISWRHRTVEWLRGADRRRRGLPSLPRLRRRQERRDAKGGHRE